MASLARTTALIQYRSMKTAQRFIASVLLLLLLGAAVRADDIDDFVEARRKELNVPGLSIAVVEDGQVVKAQGYGLANIELNVPATADTVYQYASVTKQFTAAAVLLLVEDQKLALDDPIAKHLGDVPEAWKKVTVRHLLNHTSGIKSYTSLAGFARNVRKDYTQAELIGLVRDLPLEFEPGEKFAYNNTGYFLLGMLIEKVSGKKYGEFLQERIFGPLGMKTARVNDRSEIIPNRAAGYQWVGKKHVNADFVSPTQPFSAGALVGTVRDLAKWDAALHDNKFLKPASRELMWTATRLNGGTKQDYGFGWGLGDIRGRRFVGHGGGILGFSTLIMRFLDERVTVIVLMNAPGDVEALSLGLAGRHLQGLLLSSRPAKPDPDPKLTERLKQCLAELAEKRDSPLITPQFRANYAQSRSRAESLKSRLAQLKSFSYVDHESPAAGKRERLGAKVHEIRYYKMVTAKETRFYTFDLTADGKVAFYQSSAD
jgi:D-alanyl-D-alanine carboxypeptidase